MHEFTTCFILWCKRFLKRPLFLFSLLLMPASVLFLQNCHTAEDAVIRVALCAPENDSDRTGEWLIQHMISLSNSAIKFYNCSSEDEIKADILNGRAACGYILPEKLSEKLREFAKSQTPYIQAYRAEEDIRTRIVDEIVLSKLYQELSYERLANFLSRKQDTTPDEDWLHTTFQKHNRSELLFRFEYANGDENTLLSDTHTNYMLMPIRGITSVMILLCCLTGGFFRYSDAKNGLLLANTGKRRLCNLLSLLVPGMFSGIIGLITIKMTGTLVSLTTEIPAMLLFLLCCMSLANLLCTVFARRESYLAAIPVLVIAALILSPVFISLESFAPGLAPISRVFPTTIYLSAIHASSVSIMSLSSIISSISFGICSSLTAALYFRIKGYIF